MLFLITNRKLIKKYSFQQVIQQAVNGGVDCIILREKDLNTRELIKLANQIKNIKKIKKVKLIINSNQQVAEEVKAYGIQVSYKDFIFNKYSTYKGCIGVSVHTVEEAISAENKGADYILASHIFYTNCKKDLQPKGLRFLDEIISKVNIPVIALGGINETNIKSVYNTGVRGVAVMSYIMGAHNPFKAAKMLHCKEVT